MQNVLSRGKGEIQEGKKLFGTKRRERKEISLWWEREGGPRGVAILQRWWIRTPWEGDFQPLQAFLYLPWGWLQALGLWQTTTGLSNADVMASLMAWGMKTPERQIENRCYRILQASGYSSDLNRKPVPILPDANSLTAWEDVCLNSYFIWFIENKPIEIFLNLWV